MKKTAYAVFFCYAIFLNSFYYFFSAALLSMFVIADFLLLLFIAVFLSIAVTPKT